MSPEEKIAKLQSLLKEKGIQLDEISHLEAALKTTKQPLHKRALSILKANWNRVKGEVNESKELSRLLKKAQKEGIQSLSNEEKIIIKTQLKDFFRVFPATLVAGVNAVLPIPGTGVFTPLLLRKLGLLPSRWREAHMLKTLQEAHRKLKSQGDENSVLLLEELQRDVEDEARERTVCDLLVVWDANNNGKWDPEEVKAYQQELKRTQKYWDTDMDEKNWFLLNDGLVFGPTSFHKIPDDIENLLIRYQDKTEWVRFSDLEK